MKRTSISFIALIAASAGYFWCQGSCSSAVFVTAFAVLHCAILLVVEGQAIDANAIVSSGFICMLPALVVMSQSISSGTSFGDALLSPPDWLAVIFILTASVYFVAGFCMRGRPKQCNVTLNRSMFLVLFVLGLASVGRYVGVGPVTSHPAYLDGWSELGRVAPVEFDSRRRDSGSLLIDRNRLGPVEFVRYCGALPGCEFEVIEAGAMLRHGPTSVGEPWVPSDEQVYLRADARGHFVHVHTIGVQSAWMKRNYFFDRRNLRLLVVRRWDLVIYAGVHGVWWWSSVTGLVICVVGIFLTQNRWRKIPTTIANHSSSAGVSVAVYRDNGVAEALPDCEGKSLELRFLAILVCSSAPLAVELFLAAVSLVKWHHF